MARNDNTRPVDKNGCSWCGHKPHGRAKCASQIQVDTKNSKPITAPCPCNHIELGLRGCAPCQKLETA